MSKIKIGNMIYITFVSMIIYILCLAFGNYYIIQAEASNSDMLYNNYGKIQGDVSMGFAYFQEVKVDLRNILYLYSRDSEKQAAAIERIKTTRENMEESFKKAEKEFIDDEILDKYKEAQEQIGLYLADVDTCLLYVSQRNMAQARTHLYENGVQSANEAAELVNQLIEDLQSKASAMLENEARNRKISNAIVLIFLVFVVLSTMFRARILIRIIRNPLVKLTEIAGRIASGDIDHDIERNNNSKNEIMLLHNSFCDMAGHLKQQARVLEQLAGGNLDIDYTPVSTKDVVGKAIEKLIKDNNTAFSVIKSAAKQITIGSVQIASASQTLAQGSTEQASAIQQISASITDIANKTKDNAAQANEVNSIVLETKDDITSGNEYMNEMVSAMEEINEASENIQKIIKVIDDIAFNTNILALNASVEAARAGEHGKGFAVVAEEVRNLAGRSAQASSQTAGMIEDSIEKVKRGSYLAKETAKSLALVSGMVDKITSLSTDIAEASNNQATATAQIDQALAQVSHVVQTNSATSQQCASASEELSGQIRGLEVQVSKFKLKNQAEALETYKEQPYALEYEEPVMIGSRD
ncbi:MAG: MCP four helix bundle domain-containing protein [Lachnospiraceae bacterium]|nr:MCP four helix bundle domain-containing protein [Lachnospiraceae bacterium]